MFRVGRLKIYPRFYPSLLNLNIISKIPPHFPNISLRNLFSSMTAASSSSILDSNKILMTSNNNSYFTDDVINRNTFPPLFHDLILEMHNLMKPISCSSAVLLHFTMSSESITAIYPKLIGLAKKIIDDIVMIPNAEKSFSNTIQSVAMFEGHFRTLSGSLMFPKNVSVDKDIRKASLEASKAIDDFLVEFGMRIDLFKAVEYVSKSKEASFLRGEDRRLLDFLLRDYRRNGMFLDQGSQDQIKSLKKEITNLCTDFSQTVNEDTTFVLFVAEELEGCTADFLQSLEKVPSDVDHPSGDGKFCYKVTTKYPDLSGVLKFAKKESTREKLDTINNQRFPENADRLLKIIHLRDQLAKILGYKDHAAYVLEEKMAKTPAHVASFYDDLIPRLMPIAEKERAKMRQMKSEETGDSLDKIQLQPWDVNYYHRKLEEASNIDTTKIRAFFEYNRVTKDMLQIYEETLGLVYTEIVEDPMALWHSDVRLFQVNNRPTNGQIIGELIGYFYLDMFPRDGKYGHAACFDQQPGFSLLSFPVPRENVNGSSLPAIDRRQLPCAIMVANFVKPTSDKPSLLDFTEVVTYFHEFGHVMHTICSATKYARFHGCAVEGDFVEAPSQMLENWCFDKQIISRLAHHYLDASQSLDHSVVEAIRVSKLLDIGLMTLRQVFFGKFDLAVHSSSILPLPQTKEDLIRLWKDTRLSITGLQENPDLSIFGGASFGHIVGGYDAGYYGYLWSLVVATDMYYSKFLVDGQINPQMGQFYRDLVLKPGNSIDAVEIIKNFLGRDSNQEAFLRSIGLA